jgi:hypothetical protein
MEGVIFEKASDYIATCKTTSERIAVIDSIIDALLLSSVKAAESGYIDEYWFDDGHVKIRNKYRNVTDMERSLTSFQRLRTMYAEEKRGRMTRLIDESNLKGPC